MGLEMGGILIELAFGEECGAPRLRREAATADLNQDRHGDTVADLAQDIDAVADIAVAFELLAGPSFIRGGARLAEYHP